MKLRAILLSLIIAATIFFAAACEKVTISKLANNPTKYNNKEVGVIGTVKKTYGINIPLTSVRGGVYEVDDGTGTIWVVTQSSVPRQGARIGVKGRFQDVGVQFGGKTYGGLGLIETDRSVK